MLVGNRHLLSLKDLNNSSHIEELIDAGITSFKIEGRLKDSDYVKNTTAYYRKAIDDVLCRRNDLQRASLPLPLCPLLKNRSHAASPTTSFMADKKISMPP